MTKSEKYLNFVEEIVGGKHNLFSVRRIAVKPDCLNSVMLHMKETLNVWEDTKKLADKKYCDSYNLFGNKVKTIIRIRIEYLKGTYDFEVESKACFFDFIHELPIFFTDNAIKSALRKLDMNSFLNKETVYDTAKMREYEFMGYPFVQPCFRDVMIPNKVNGLSYQERQYGNVYLVVNRNSLKYSDAEKTLLKYCLLYDYPYLDKWFKKYDTGVYGYDRGDYHLYISLPREDENGTLIEDKNGYNPYGSVDIPFECFKKRSIQPCLYKMKLDTPTNRYNKNQDAKYNGKMIENSKFKDLVVEIERGY